MVKAQATREAVLGSTPQLPAVGADTLPGKSTEPVGAEAGRGREDILQLKKRRMCWRRVLDGTLTTS